MTRTIVTLKDLHYQQVALFPHDTPWELAERRLNADCLDKAIIVREENVLGVLTPRDRLRAVQQKKAPTSPVEALLTRTPVALDHNLSISDACSRAGQGGDGDLIVVDDLGRPLGLLDDLQLLQQTRSPNDDPETTMERLTSSPHAVEVLPRHADVVSTKDSILSTIGNRWRAADLVGDVSDQSDIDTQFRTRKRQADLLSRFATTLINLPADSSDAAVNHALMQMGELAQVDRAYIFRYDFEANTGTNTHEWCAAGIKPQIGNLQQIPLTHFTDWVEAHRREESLIVKDTEALPAGALKDLLSPQFIKSLVSLPIIGRDGCIGFLGFDSVRSRREYGPEELDILALFARTLANYQERVNAEQKLANSEANFHAFFDQTQDLLFVLSHDGDIVQFNAQVERRLGFDPDELYGKSILLLHAPECREDVAWTIKAMAESSLDHHAIPMQTRTGQRVPVETQVVAGQWNAIPALFMVCRDVSDISASEEKFSKAFHLSPMPMFIADLQREIFLELNEAFGQVTGHDSQATVGREIASLGLFEDPEQWGVITHSLQQLGQVENIETPMRTRHGDSVSGLFNAAVLELQGRQVMISQVLDITARKVAEEALDNERIQLRSLINSQPNLVWLKDPDGIYLMCNAMFESLFGMPESEILGKTDQDFVNKDLAAFFREHDQKAMRAGKTCVNEEHLTFSATGYKGIFETTKTPIFNANDKLIGVLGVARDITDARHAEENRRRIERELHQAQKMEALGQLSGGVAHEFNNMLAIILGYKDLLQDRLGPEADPSLHAWLDHIDVAGVRAKELVLQLLSFSRPSETQTRRMSLEAGVRNAIVLSQSSLPSSIEIDYRSASFLPDVQLDAGELQQVLTNLLVNARDAMNGQGRIEVSLQLTRLSRCECQVCHSLVEGEWVELCISDNGSGIERDLLSRIFEPFYTTKSVGKGTGLGLSMVSSAVEHNGGHILLETGAGQGTRFRLLFPPLDYEPMEPSSSQKRTDTPSIGNGRVLVVDDEPALSEYLKHALEYQGLTVVALTDSREACALLDDPGQQFDLLITDQTMPGMLGTELALHAKSRRRDLKVILCTGHSEQVNADNASEYGIDGFLEKPVSIQNIVLAIDSVNS